MAALDPQAPVWKKVSQDISVFHARDDEMAVDLLAELPANTCVIPLMEVHALTVPPASRSLTANASVIELLSDKAQFVQWMKRCGKGKLIPNTAFGKPLRKFPQLLKKTRLNGGRGQVIVSSKAEMRTLLNRPKWHSGDWIAQEAIHGIKEYVWHVICKDGEVLWSLLLGYVLPREFSIRPDGRSSPKIAALPESALKPLVTLLKKLNYTGPANIDFKIVGRKPIIFEINPRFGGSLMLPKFVDYLAEALQVIVTEAEKYPGSQ